MNRSKHRRHARPQKQPEEPDLSEPVGETSMENRAVKVYLVKMPNFLIERFASAKPDASGAPPIVGRLRIPDAASLGASADDNEGEDSTQFPKIFMENGKKTDGTPDTDEYELMFQPDEPTIYVFSGKPQGENPDMRIEGQVSYLCTTRPKFDTKYRTINRTRRLKAETKARTTLRMDESSRRAADLTALKPNAMVETTKQREERKKSKEDARKHLDVPDEQWRELAKVAVFKAFEIHAYYSAEQLAKDVDEPLSRLRSVINDVCTYNKSGPLSGKYELKDEFKTVAQRQQKERELEEYKQAQLESIRRRREERAERERLEGPPNKRSKTS